MNNNILNKFNLLNIKDDDDVYTEDILKKQFYIHRKYVLKRKEIKVKIRFPGFPEDISENIIKFILINTCKLSSCWGKIGDLNSELEGNQECKSFTSDGPISFSPSSSWNVIYFLDAREWLSNIFILYRVALSDTSDVWKNIKVNKNETFYEQRVQKRRPRITWNNLYSQLTNKYAKVIFHGSFEDVFKSSK